MHFESDTSSDDTEIVAFMEPDCWQPCGWMDDRWNEDDYGTGLSNPEGGGSMSRAAGERMNTPLNHVEV